MKPPAPVEPPRPTPIEIPHRAGTPVVVTKVRPVQAALFPEELDRLTRWIGHHLATETEVALDVVPFEQVEQARALRDAHRLAPDAPACAAEPELSAVLSRQFPEAARAHTFADCSSKPCRLIVEVTKEVDGTAKRLGLWQAEVPAPFGFDQWQAAAQMLKSVPDAALPNVPAFNPTVRPERAQITIPSVTAQGPWIGTPKPVDFDEVKSMFNQCHEKGRASRGNELLALDYDEEGKAIRCTGYSWSQPAPNTLLECLCGIAREPNFGQGDAHRRLAVSLRDPTDLYATTPEGETISARIEDFHSTNPGYGKERFAPILPWTGLCYGITRLRDEVTVSLKLQVDATGAVQSVERTGPTINDTLAGCVQGYFRYVPFPCTTNNAPATIELTLHLARELPGDDRVDEQPENVEPAEPVQKVPVSAAPSAVGSSRS